jgi:hypothetical protein
MGLWQPRLPPLREGEVPERHRRPAPGELRRLPGLPQGHSPRVVMESAADIGAVGV